MSGEAAYEFWSSLGGAFPLTAAASAGAYRAVRHHQREQERDRRAELDAAKRRLGVDDGDDAAYRAACRALTDADRAFLTSVGWSDPNTPRATPPGPGSSARWRTERPPDASWVSSDRV